MRQKDSVIETKEMPIVSFCVFCDKPIYIGEEYKEVEYFDNASNKKFHKRDKKTGLAHLRCALEKEKEIEELKHKNQENSKSKQYFLALGVVGGFIIALGLMIILLFANVTHLAFSIIFPWVLGYALMSFFYILFSKSKLADIYRNVALKIIFFPKWIHESGSEVTYYIVIKILMYIILVPLDYLVLLLLFVISLPISMVAFPILLVKR